VRGGTTQGEDETSPSEVKQLIDEVCDRFEAAWKARQKPWVEDFLGTVPESGCAAKPTPAHA
jgi:hypothetical protein